MAFLGLLTLLMMPSWAKDTLTKVNGTITGWDAKGLTLRADGKEWRMNFDPQKTMVDGHPQVDVEATCWYKKADNGDLWLMRLQVDQSGENIGNLLVPQVGQVQGQLVKMNPTTVVVRAVGQEWTMAVDGGKTEIAGKPAIDDIVNVTFYNDKAGNLNALYIEKADPIDVVIIED